MAAHGAVRLLGMVENATGIIGIEYLAAQGCDFHAPLRSAPALEAARDLLRRSVPPLEEDRLMHPDMVIATDLFRSAALAGVADYLRTVMERAG